MTHSSASTNSKDLQPKKAAAGSLKTKIKIPLIPRSPKKVSSLQHQSGDDRQAVVTAPTASESSPQDGSLSSSSPSTVATPEVSLSTTSSSSSASSSNNNNDGARPNAAGSSAPPQQVPSKSNGDNNGGNDNSDNNSGNNSSSAAEGQQELRSLYTTWAPTQYHEFKKLYEVERGLQDQLKQGMRAVNGMDGTLDPAVMAKVRAMTGRFVTSLLMATMDSMESPNVFVAIALIEGMPKSSLHQIFCDNLSNLIHHVERDFPSDAVRSATGWQQQQQQQPPVMGPAFGAPRGGFYAPFPPQGPPGFHVPSTTIPPPYSGAMPNTWYGGPPLPVPTMPGFFAGPNATTLGGTSGTYGQPPPPQHFPTTAATASSFYGPTNDNGVSSSLSYGAAASSSAYDISNANKSVMNPGGFPSAAASSFYTPNRTVDEHATTTPTVDANANTGANSSGNDQAE